MIDIGIAVVCGIFYAMGQYKLAFWLIVFAIANGAGAALRAIINPDWYFEKRVEAGLGVDLFNSGIRSLLITKAIIVALLAWAALYVGEKAGYL